MRGKELRSIREKDLKPHVWMLTAIVYVLMVMFCVHLVREEREEDFVGNIRATYAGIGIEAGSGVDFTLQRGISPSVVTVTLKAGTLLAAVPLEGDLVITDGVETITISVWVDGDIVQRRSKSGDLIAVTLKDRRWKWKYGYFSGSFNQPDKEGNPVEEINAHDIFELARGYIDSAGEEDGSTFVLDDVPVNKYPAMSWETIVPAQAIQQMCDELGLCVILDTDGIAYVKVLGTGAALPAGSFNQVESTVPAPELPISIWVVGGRIVREKNYDDWEAVGEETEANDSEIKPLTELSYAPGGGTLAEWGEALKDDFIDFDDDEKKKLAQKCVFKWFRWREDDVDLRDDALPWLPNRAAPVTVGGVAQGDNERAAPLMKVSYVGVEELTWAYIDLTLAPVADGWSLDHTKGIIKFSDAKYQRDNPGDNDVGVVEMPDIDMLIAYEIDSETDPLDNFYSYLDGPVTWPGGAIANAGDYISKMPELVQYEEADGTPYNSTELDTYAATLVDLIQTSIWDGLTGSAKTYLGMKVIAPDGAITSVTWHISKSGATTKVVRGQDRPPINLPTYKDFQHKLRNARATSENKVKSDDIGRQVREGRASTVQTRAEGTDAKFKGRRLGELAIKNTDATDAPAGGLAEIVNMETATGAVEIKRPTGNNLSNVVVLKSAVAANKYGAAREGKVTSFITHSGAVPSVGDKVGTVAGQWEAEVAAEGTHEVTAVDPSDNVFAKPAGGGGGPLVINVTNKSGETAPVGAWVEVYDWDDTTQKFFFRKPTADNLETAYILTAELADEADGTAWDKGVTIGAYFDSDPAQGAPVGSVNGEWYGAASDEGTHVLIAQDYTGA